MAKDGIITRKDIIEDQALTIGQDYAKNMQSAIEANKQLVASLKEMAPLVNAFRKTDSQQQYIALKQQENLITLQAINANKLLEASEISLERIKQAKLKTEKEVLTVEAKMEAAKKRNTQLTIEERVQNEIYNRALKQEALERLGLVSAYTKLNKARTDAKNKLRDLIASEKASTIEINKAQKAFDALDAKVRRADKAVGDFTKNVGNYKSAFSGISDLFGAFGVVGGLAGFAATVQNIFSVTKELQSLELALKSVTETEANFKDQQLFLTTIAQKHGLEIRALTKEYISFYVAAKDKLSGNEIQQIFEDISRSGSALGLSNEALGRSFQAVNQMLSKGTVASEELRGQLAESLPGAVQAMTKAVQKLHPEIKNLTEKGLFEMIKDGKILANEVLPETARQLALITGADKAQGMETLTKMTNKLTNDYTEMVESINNTNTSGFGQFVKKVVGGLSTILQFTSLLFKDEKQLQEYFTNLGKTKGLDEYQAIMKNIATVSVEQQEATKKALLERERENIRVNQAIVASEKKKRESILGGDRALFHLQTKAEEDALVRIGKSAAIIKKLNEDALNANNKITQKTPEEETEKEKKAREKAIRDRLAAEKKARQDYLALLKKNEDDAYNLEKFGLDRVMELNQEIVDDEKKSSEKRLNAFLEIEQLKVASSESTLRHELVQNALSKIDAETTSKEKMDIIKKEAELKAQNLINGVQLSENATNAEKLIYEKFSNEVEDINRKSQQGRQKIIDSEVDLVKKQAEASIQTQDTELSKALEAENIKYNALISGQKNIKDATEEHERQILAIKEIYAKKALQVQIDAIQKLLDQQDALPKEEQISADKRAKIENDLAKYKLQLSEITFDAFKVQADKRIELEKEANERIKELSTDLKDALVDLTNNIFDARINNIDNEISASNDYYDQQMELAGNDERQKTLLENERARKEKALQREKQKEIVKQAIFNKTIATLEIGLNLAKTISAINLAAAQLDAISFGIAGTPYRAVQIPLAIGVATAQAAAVLAAPVPKYKMGRKGGPAEVAEVGDGGVREVISRPDGSGARITPNKPTLTYLQKDDVVHKSMADYNEYMRRSIMKSFYKEKELASSYHYIPNHSNNNPELLEELKKNTEAIKKQKTNVNVHNNIDLGHEFWKMSNVNWRA